MTAALLSLGSTLTQTHARSTAAALVAQMRAQAQSGATPCVVDGAQLTHFDSSALSVLLELQRAAAALQQALRLQNMPSELQTLARVYGVESVIAA